MPPLIHPRLNRKRVIGRAVEEILYCTLIWGWLMMDCSGSHRFMSVLGAWLALTLMTVFGSYVGQLVRTECKDLDYVWLSLHQKIPDWVLWTFWPVVCAVWINPLFAPLAYIATALATIRGFWFRRHCMGYRAVTAVDIGVRLLAGALIACL